MSIYKTEEGKKIILDYYREVLDSCKLNSEESYINSSIGSTFVISYGDKNNDVIILLHGTGTNSATWLSDVVEYSKEYRVICIDIPGEAGFSSLTRQKLKPEVYNLWLKEIFTELGIKKAHIIGQSIGGWIGLNYFISNKDFVSSLTLISPSGVYKPKILYFLKFIFFSLTGSWGQKRILDMLRNDMNLDSVAEKFFLLTLNHFVFRSEVPMLLTDDELKQIDIPLFYIAGEKDPLLDSKKTANRLKEFVKNITLDINTDGYIIINQCHRILKFVQNI